MVDTGIRLPTPGCGFLWRAALRGWAILTVLGIGLMSGVGLSAQAKNESVRNSTEVPNGLIQTGWNNGWHVTSVTGASNGNWTVVMSSRSGYRSQSIGWDSSFPGDFVRESWNDGKRITEIAYTNSTWLVVTSQGSGLRNQRYDWTSSPATKMGEFRNAGHHITDLAYGGGQWVVVGSSAASFGDQIYTSSGSFPATFISENWDDGYRITELAFGNGIWAVVMTELLSWPAQGYTGWTDSAIEGAWNDGRQVLDIVYGDGSYKIVTTGSLGETMGLPPPSGGVLRTRAQRQSTTSGTFTLDAFVVGSDSRLLSLDADDFTISGFDLDGTRIEFQRTNVATYSQNSAGPYSAQFLLDQSGSITSTDPRDARIDAAKAFMRNLGSGDEVGLMAFASGGSLPYSPTTVYSRGGERFISEANGWDSRLNELADLEGGGTPLYDATHAAVRSVVEHGDNSNRVVLVFTDGEDTASSGTLDQIIRYANQHDVPLHTIALSNGVNMAVLSQMAGETGGSLARAVDARRLISYYGALGPYLSGSGQFYRSTWNVLLSGGSFRLGSGAWITSSIEVEIPGSDIYLPFRLDF